MRKFVPIVIAGVVSLAGAAILLYKFNDKATAQKWLNTEEYDFRERELMSKTAAIKLAGRKSVDNAEEI